MATIKLQPSGAVVIKDGKVSCTCCATELCCMYFAQSFLSDYITYNDLPDQVVAGGVVLSKEDGGGESGIYYTDGQNYIQWVGFYWLLIGPITQFYTFESSCLIGEYINIPFDEYEPVFPPILVEDQFADTYTVSGPISGTVTRKSECVWRGSNLQLANLYTPYTGVPPRELGFQWKVNGNNKTGFQNTPVGSYEGGYTVS